MTIGDKVDSLLRRPVWAKVAHSTMPTLSKLDTVRSRKHELDEAWISHPRNPILHLAKSSNWDCEYSTWASVVLNGGSWNMYYSGKDKAGRLRIGLAKSRNGIHWIRHDHNPIVDVGSQGSWDSLWVYCPMVLTDQESWKMLFTGCDSPECYHFQLGLATSEDGIHWTKFAENPVFSSRDPHNVNMFGNHETEGWGLMQQDNHYFLFHNSVTRKPREISIARSRDLIEWEEIGRVLSSSGLPWQLGYMKYCAWPFEHNGETYLLASVTDVNYAVSRIGLWKIEGSLDHIKHVQLLGYLRDSSDWCRREVDTPYVLSHENNLICYYGGRDENNKWTEGLARINLGGSL
jgi:predicted GH43/DUF377 family glycosyl hydrolase